MKLLLESSLNIIKKFYLVILFIISVILMYLFNNVNFYITTSPKFIVFNSVIFILTLIIFIFLIIIYLKKVLKINNIKKINRYDFFSLIFVILFSIFFIFIYLKDSFVGRFTILNVYLGNIFIKDIFNDALLGNPRSYSMVVYSILQEILPINITPMDLLIVNKVISIFLLIVVFQISKILFKKNWISLIIFFSFISSIFIQMNLASFEYRTISIFFTYTSILFLFKFIKDRKLNYFILSNICIILSAYYSYGVSFLFGLPYIAHYCIFINKDKRTNFFMLITTVILIMIFMPALELISNNDENVLGEKVDGVNIISLFTRNLDILKNNIFVEKDLLLTSGYVSLFSYVGLITSLILIAILIYNSIKHKVIEMKYKPFFLLAFFNIFVVFFQLAFALEGLRSAWKYSVQYFIGEVILSYFVILWFIDKIFRKNSNWINIAKLLSLVVFFFLALISTNALAFVGSHLFMGPEVYSYSLDHVYTNKKNIFIIPEIFEMELLKKNVSFDTHCKIIKIDTRRPNLDYYFGLQKNSVYFGSPPHFYNSIENYNKTGICFYYYDEKFLDDDYYFKQGIKFKIDSKKVDQLFSFCNRTVELESPLKWRPFSLIKYDC